MPAISPQVFVVDDDSSVRVGLTRSLRSAGHAVAAFASAAAFFESDSHHRPGCVVLDLRLPDLDGMACYERLRMDGASMPVIFFTGHGDIPTTVRAMKAGAIDFLPKPVADNVLLRAVEAALAEDARVRAERADQDEIARRFELLTKREREVLRLVLAGRLNKQIGHELGIAEQTVKVHRGRVMAKMQVDRVAQLVSLTARLGVVA